MIESELKPSNFLFDWELSAAYYVCIDYTSLLDMRCVVEISKKPHVIEQLSGSFYTASPF